jgi:sulfur-oxidizing protein SoxA
MTNKKLLGGGALGAIAIALSGVVSADIGDDESLIVNGEIEMITEAAAPAHLDGSLSTIYSGWRFRSDETQAIQADDFDNPAFIFVDQAIAEFNTVMGSEGNSCASCHTPDDFEMTRSTYPQWDEERGEVQTVEMQIIECQTERMGMEEPYPYDNQAMRNMSALVSSEGRGQVVNVAIDGPAQSVWEQGREIYYTRFGQLELSCANCHEQNYGNNIRADHLSQGMINGFPTYRLKQANLVSVHNRFRGCIRDTRAETYPVGSPEFVALELYVQSRANGLTVEGPAVRN